ncbi:hypothetical protein SAMN04244553_2050 [Nocardia amikacinitolerans]|uniref:Uncharacterized protein n=1 Tax=Nocardia amikacinitolerans TaxID=756689 RepID=A0A285LAS0_9NOCA|nr:hypothetical protein [Nocardia amikacinitolerans]MCP2296553.1 hypothetical protein [Nocardia amikacinitolerans]SNY80481.1 hypothetical protein SAMN04244553_2050 [Nocardia amikacinitolerans]
MSERVVRVRRAYAGAESRRGAGMSGRGERIVRPEPSPNEVLA